MTTYITQEQVQPAQLDCDCGRTHKLTAYGWASNEPAQGERHPLLQRATDLHEKAGMPWTEAERLALSEADISDGDIEELVGEHASHILQTFADRWEDLENYTRSLLVHGAALLQSNAERVKPNCKECAKWSQEQADNKEWIDGVSKGNEIIRKLAQAEIKKGQQ